MKLTVFFDGQFWIGLVEIERQGGLSAARHVFGAEPHDDEILAFVRHELTRLIESRSAIIPVESPPERNIGFKRRLREAARLANATPVSSVAHAALQAELEQRKKTRRILTRDEKEAAAKRRYALSRAKAKARHRGR